MLAAIGRRARQGDAGGIGPQQRREPAPHVGAQPVELAPRTRRRGARCRDPRAAACRIASTVGRASGPNVPGVQVREPLEHRKLGAGLLERHPISASIGAWSESSTPSSVRRASGQVAVRPSSAPRTST